MSLGPVNHGQLGLPQSENIENFHQGSKCYSIKTDKNGNPSKLFYSNRLKFCKDSRPHRHKYRKDKTNYNLFFVLLDILSNEHHLDYINSRQFYCNFRID